MDNLVMANNLVQVIFYSIVPRPTAFNNSGKFTDVQTIYILFQHLLNATMYRNNSLNSTCDKERWVNGSKDWMEHLQ